MLSHVIITWLVKYGKEKDLKKGPGKRKRQVTSSWWVCSIWSPGSNRHCNAISVCATTRWVKNSHHPSCFRHLRLLYVSSSLLSPPYPSTASLLPASTFVSWGFFSFWKWWCWWTAPTAAFRCSCQWAPDPYAALSVTPSPWLPIRGLSLRRPTPLAMVTTPPRGSRRRCCLPLTVRCRRGSRRGWTAGRRRWCAACRTATRGMSSRGVWTMPSAWSICWWIVSSFLRLPFSCLPVIWCFLFFQFLDGYAFLFGWLEKGKRKGK